MRFELKHTLLSFNGVEKSVDFEIKNDHMTHTLKNPYFGAYYFEKKQKTSLSVAEIFVKITKSNRL